MSKRALKYTKAHSEKITTCYNCNYCVIVYLSCNLWMYYNCTLLTYCGVTKTSNSATTTITLWEYWRNSVNQADWRTVYPSIEWKKMTEEWMVWRLYIDMIVCMHCIVCSVCSVCCMCVWKYDSIVLSM